VLSSVTRSREVIQHSFLATSTNSQAITHVIELFARILRIRWHPAGSLGSTATVFYWPPAGKNEEEARQSGLQFVSNSEQGDFPSMIETRDYFDQARTYFSFTHSKPTSTCARWA